MLMRLKTINNVAISNKLGIYFSSNPTIWLWKAWERCV